MTILKYDNDFIYLKGSTFEGSFIGGHYNQTSKHWRVPISLEAIEQLSQVCDTKPIEPVIKKLNSYRHWVKELKSNNHTVSYEDSRLRPYQAVDIEFLKKRNAAGIFNEQRTGKTPTTLVAVKDANKVVVVCPAGLKLNWQKEASVWLNRDSIVVSGPKPNRKLLYKAFSTSSSSFLIISYETLRADLTDFLREIQDIDALIADESHRLRNYKTAQSKAVYKVGKVSKKIYALTGTPAVNHAKDIYGILRLLKPKKYPSYWQFVERYFTVVEGPFGRDVYGLRKDREKEFSNILFDTSINRKRKDVMAWIPKVTNTTIPLEFGQKQKRHYLKALKEFMYGIEGEEKDIPNTLAQLTRLRQICTEPSLLELDAESVKTEFIKEFLDDNTGSVIIFSSFTSYLNHLASVVDNAVLLTGEQSAEQKEEAVQLFQRGDRRVLLANIRAGGVGFTLDRADTIIFVDRSYNPVDNEQAADRFVPTDPNKEYGAKEIIDLVIKGSIEENINTLLKTKQNIISYVNNFMEKGLVDLVKNEL